MSDTLCTTCWTFDCEGHAQSEEHIQVNGNLSVLPKGEGVNLTGSLDVCFSDYGQQILEEMMLLQGHPLLLLGDSGWGKSVIAREVGRRCGYAGDTTPVETNAYPNMDISLWMGQWLPSSENGAVSVNWHDGEMTRAIRSGALFLLEEITRAPQDGLARFFGPTDNGYRYHTLPESGEGRIPVQEDFWLVATGNPAGGGYATSKLDKALHSRFKATWIINEPLADERKLVANALPENEHGDIGQRLLTYVLEARRGADSQVNTRDLMHCVDLIALGFKPERAIELSIVPKYENQQGLRDNARLHFSAAAVL
jgi:nitric oxide reductase NorQ protein